MCHWVKYRCGCCLVHLGEDEKAAIKLRGSKPISSIMKSGDKQNVAIHVTFPTNIVSGALACIARLVNYLRMIKYHGR
jgi:hypothetical protein